MNLKILLKLVDKEKRGGMFKEGLDQFYFNCRLKNLSVATLKCYGERLNDFYNFIQKKSVPFENVDRSVVQEYILNLEDKVSDYNLNGRLRVLKVSFNFLIKEGIWDGKPNPMEKVDYVRAEKKFKPVISVEEMEKILTVPNRRAFEGYRNYCMILVFWDCLVRLSELINIKVSNVDLKEGVIKVLGKGRKERFIPVGLNTLKCLHYCWTKHRRNIQGDYFFCIKDGKPLNVRGVERILERIGKKVGIKIGPHLIRHSGGTFWIKEDGSPYVLQKILGHTTQSTTQLYVHLAGVDVKEAYSHYSPADKLRL